MFGRRMARWREAWGECGGMPPFFAAGRFGWHGGDFGEGRGGRHGGGRFGARMFGQGDLRLVLLALIAEAPRHGYELIKAIEEKFGGAYAPSPGAIYPTLTLLEEQDHIRATAEAGGKRRFEITDEGRAFLEQNRAIVDGVFARMALVKRAMADRRTPETVRQAMHTLRHALLIRGPWTEDQTRRILAILDRATREIAGG